MIYAILSAYYISAPATKGPRPIMKNEFRGRAQCYNDDYTARKKPDTHKQWHPNMDAPRN